MALYTVRATGMSLSASTAKTLIQVAAGSNTTIQVVEVGISFNDATTTDGAVLVDLLRQSTAGTMTSTSPVIDWEDCSKTVVASGQSNATAEPTAGNILRSWNITPIGGLFVMQWALGREPTATTRIGIRANATNSQTNVAAYITFNEC